LDLLRSNQYEIVSRANDVSQRVKLPGYDHEKLGA
jgi:hypothetical protein